LPESVPLKRAALARLSAVVADDAIVASGSSTISPSHLTEAIKRPERFLVAHWLNPAHIIPLVDVVPSPLTSTATVERTLALLEGLGKVPVKCKDSPGFIGPRLQVLPMNEAVRLVEEGVATPEDVDHRGPGAPHPARRLDPRRRPRRRAGGPGRRAPARAPAGSRHQRAASRGGAELRGHARPPHRASQPWPHARRHSGGALPGRLAAAAPFHRDAGRGA